MSLNVGKEIASLKKMGVAELRIRYAEVFGEATRAAPGIEHELSFELGPRPARLGFEATLRRVRTGDAVELRRPEHVPLLPERVRVRRLRNEARDAPEDRVDGPRLNGREFSLLDPLPFVARDLQLEHGTRARFGQDVDEALVHTASLSSSRP